MCEKLSNCWRNVPMCWCAHRLQDISFSADATEITRLLEKEIDELRTTRGYATASFASLHLRPLY